LTVTSIGVAIADGSATGEPLKSGMVAFTVASTEPEVGVPGIVTFVNCARSKEACSKAAKQSKKDFMAISNIERVQQTFDS